MKLKTIRQDIAIDERDFITELKKHLDEIFQALDNGINEKFGCFESHIVFTKKDIYEKLGVEKIDNIYYAMIDLYGQSINQKIKTTIKDGHFDEGYYRKIAFNVKDSKGYKTECWFFYWIGKKHTCMVY